MMAQGCCNHGGTCWNQPAGELHSSMKHGTVVDGDKLRGRGRALRDAAMVGGRHDLWCFFISETRTG